MIDGFRGRSWVFVKRNPNVPTTDDRKRYEIEMPSLPQAEVYPDAIDRSSMLSAASEGLPDRNLESTTQHTQHGKTRRRVRACMDA